MHPRQTENKVPMYAQRNTMRVTLFVQELRQLRLKFCKFAEFDSKISQKKTWQSFAIQEAMQCWVPSFKGNTSFMWAMDYAWNLPATLLCFSNKGYSSRTLRAKYNIVIWQHYQLWSKQKEVLPNQGKNTNPGFQKTFASCREADCVAYPWKFRIIEKHIRNSLLRNSI